MPQRIVLVTGGFDPLHSGHIEYFKAAKQLGDRLVVAVNSDAWLARKKGRPFMNFEERANIIKHLDIVDQVIGINDNDDTACHAIYTLLSTTGSNDTIVFANGGDRQDSNTPEYELYCNHRHVEFAWSVGGDDKMNSSSWILDAWKTNKTERTWGFWRVLDDKPNAGVKVKELVIAPGASLSDQQHRFRSEHWYVLEGELVIGIEDENGYRTVKLKQHDTYVIPTMTWHKPMNRGTEPCHVLEVQYGVRCVEEDIERRDQ